MLQMFELQNVQLDPVSWSSNLTRSLIFSLTKSAMIRQLKDLKMNPPATAGVLHEIYRVMNSFASTDLLPDQFTELNSGKNWLKERTFFKAFVSEFEWIQTQV